MRNKCKFGKRLCSLLLILVMVIVILPVSLSADEGGEETETQVTSGGESETSAEAESESEASVQTESESSESNETIQSEESKSKAQTNMGSISGMLWYDANYDGTRDSGEVGIANYPVYLYKEGDKDNAVQTVRTNADGDYEFTDIEPGIYVVGVKSNELGTDYYLLPVVGVTGDNKLGMWSSGWDEKYSDSIAIDGNSAVTDVDGGLHTPPGIKPMAAYTINIGTVSAGGVGYTYASNTVTFTTAAASNTYTITGTTTANTIIVPAGVTVNLTLNGVNIKTTISPIQVLGTADITLSGSNILWCTSGSYATGGIRAGIRVPTGATLNIGGTTSDTLSAQGGGGGAVYGAGIGGEAAESCGTINISGGTVTATGGGLVYGGAGIGGGTNGSGGTINITGGTVTATGASGVNGGAGIGGGWNGGGGTVNISGGTVTATGGGSGSTAARDIGCGAKGSSGGDTVVITGGSVLPTRGESYVSSPTNGAVNGDDPVGMDTRASLASVNFSLSAIGSSAVYTYNGTGHAAGGYVWLALPYVTTDVATVGITPAVVTAPNTVNSPTSITATLNGTYKLFDSFPVTSAYFQWGTSTSYVGTKNVTSQVNTSLTTAGSYTASDTLTTAADNLASGTTYHYRFVIVTHGVTRYGDDMTFTTPSLAPSVDATHTVTSDTTATLYGIYALNGGTFTNGEFKISTTGTSGPWTTLTSTSTPSISSALGVTVATGQLTNSTTTPNVSLTNLTLGTTYYYQFTVTNDVGTYYVTGSWIQRSPTTDLEISKTVSGNGDPNKEFDVTITLVNGGTPVSRTYNYTSIDSSGASTTSSITFDSSGQGTIKLKHGQTITIEGLIQGCTYTVQETDTLVINGTYTVTYSGTGTLSSSGDSISETLGSTTSTVSIENKRDSVVVSGISGTDYRVAAIGLLAVLAVAMTTLWCYRRRKKCQ